MKQNFGNKSADAFYLDEECVSNEASSNFDTDEDDVDEHEYLINNNENSLDEQSGIKLESSRISAVKSVKKRKPSKKADYLKKRKCRTTFNKFQLNILENEFIQSNFVSNEKIDYLVQSTGLDSRIIKNWFKNKRSRVLADTKTNSLSPFKQNSVSKPVKQEQTNDDIRSIKSNSENTSNKNLSGLFSVVHSINSDEVKTKPVEKINEIKTKTDQNCLKCLRSSKELCNCSISNQALKRLYKYCSGFNTIDFVYCSEEKYSYTHELTNSNDENGKIFFSL